MKVYEHTVSELYFGREGEKIYGKLYMPLGIDRPRLAIYAHEIGCTHSRAHSYAEYLASHGIAVFAPDFRGGGRHCRSDGETTDMTVMTEVEDLERVVAFMRENAAVNCERPIIIGGSQGGFVAAIYAGRHPESVSALILLYPAFQIPDVMKKMIREHGGIPEKKDLFGWIIIGHRYFTDMCDYDSFGETMKYKGPVLILNGDADRIVPQAVAEDVAARYADAEIHILPGAEHMFSGEYTEQAIGYIDDFLERHGLLDAGR